jgi:3'(2'), 5'-bisphosphate nucleotidase
MDIYEAPAREVMRKEDNSPLTQADLAADRVINASLQNLNLGWPILSEESAQVDYSIRKNWTRYWLIDPLDGTKEFIKRNGEFTVNIALIDDGKPVLGVVYSPVLDVCYYSALGGGAYTQRGSSAGQRIHAQSNNSGQPLKIVSGRSHTSILTATLLDHIGLHESIHMGSSLKLCLVAEGSAHLYPRYGQTMEWDTAAAHAIVKEAGGVVNDVNGSELSYNKPDLHNPDFFVYAKSNQQLRKLIKELL